MTSPRLPVIESLECVDDDAPGRQDGGWVTSRCLAHARRAVQAAAVDVRGWPSGSANIGCHPRLIDLSAAQLQRRVTSGRRSIGTAGRKQADPLTPITDDPRREPEFPLGFEYQSRTCSSTPWTRSSWRCRFSRTVSQQAFGSIRFQLETLILMSWMSPTQLAERQARATRVLDGSSGRLQLTAFFTSAATFFSAAGVSSVRAKAVGHIVPSSRFAASSKPNVAYLELNFSALLKKHTTFPSLA
jgi:hypothetical protein